MLIYSLIPLLLRLKPFLSVVHGEVKDIIKLRTTYPLFQAYEHAYNLLEREYLPLFMHSHAVSSCAVVSSAALLSFLPFSSFVLVVPPSLSVTFTQCPLLCFSFRNLGKE